MGCKYYKNGVESKLYTELFGYMDNTAPEKKSAEAVYKILKSNGIATRRGGSIFLIQPNVENSLREINNINSRYPGLLNTKYIKMTQETYFSKSAELHALNINEDVLQQIAEEKDANADLQYRNQNDIDTYTRTITGSGREFQDDIRLSEETRRENTSESRFSNMQREEQAIVEKKVNHLKEAFAKAGVQVDVVYNSETESLGSIERSDIENNPLITFNPNKTTEDTVYHEFGHAYIDMLGINDPVVAKAIEELRGTDLYLQVQDRYPELAGEMLDKEVLATAIGIEGAKITRQQPTAIQKIVNRIMRAFSNMLNKLGLKTNPNTASLIAQEMFAQELRAENMVNPISSYTQYSKESRDKQKLLDITNDLRIKVRADISDVKKMPLEQQEKLLPKLERLQASLYKIDRVEDFVSFVDAVSFQMAEARQQFDQIIDLKDEKGNINYKEQATYKNLNIMYELKTKLDSLDVLKSIKTLMRKKKKDDRVLSVGAFETLEEKLNAVLEDVDVLQEDFNDEIIPIIAESLLQFHNKNIDKDLQAIIDNIQENAKNGTPRRALNFNEVKRTSEFKKLEKDLNDKKIDQETYNKKLADLQIESIKNKMMTGRSALVKQLREAQKDKSGFSYLMDPMIYSSEASLQMFTKAVDEANIKSNDETLDFKYGLKEKYDKMAAGQNEADVETLNDPFLEEVTMDVRDNDGQTKTIKVLSLVQPLAVDKYYSDQRAEYKRLAEKYNKPQRKDYNENEEYRTALSKWYNSKQGKNYTVDITVWLNENTEPVEGWQDIRASINQQIKTAQGIINKAASEEVKNMQAIKIKNLRKVLATNMLGKKPRGEWVKPKASKYTNPKYAKIQADPRLKEYYDFVLEEFQKGHKMVGVNRMEKNSWDNISYLMPSVRKEGLDRIKEQGFVSAGRDLLSDNFTIVETDDHMAVYDDVSGELKRNVPVRYTNLVESKDVSKDIASSLYRFRHMAHNFKAKSEIVGQVMLFRDIIKNRGTLEVNPQGMGYISAYAKQIGINLPILKPGESYTFKHLEEWVNMVMFGETSYKTNVGLFGKTINLEKTTGTINQFVALNTLSFNMLQGGNQYILDNLSLMQEGIAGQFVSKSDLAWATQKYWGEGAAISDMGKFTPDTKLGKAMELFDALVEFTDREGNRLVGSNLRKALDTGNLMVVQQGVEHQLAAKRMLALMKNLEGKLKDKDGNVIMKDGKPANLYDMLEIDKKTGKMSVSKEVANFNKSDFIHLLRGLGRRTNQTKGRFDSPILAKSWYGKLLMLFRSWAVPGIRRRYGHGGFTGSTIHTDEELGAVTQGMYISFFNLLSESFQDGVKSPLGVYSRMTKMEQENVKRTVTEMAALASAMALVAALSNLDDDEESYISNFMLYQAKRYETEILQWTPIFGTREAFRILKSPSATFRPIEQGASLIEQLFVELYNGIGLPIDDKRIYYQRKTGRFNKGDRKIWKDVEDLLPILRGLRTTQTPKEKYKWFTTLD